jgi:cation diffusion facilitator family transporter
MTSGFPKRDHGGHAHGDVDPAVLADARGIRAVKISLLGLLATALFQGVVVLFSGSVALLSDTIHNVGDAATAVPLWVAFGLAGRKPSRRFTYGYGRLEDLAGLAIVLAILLSAAAAGYQSMDRIFHPQPVRNLWAVVVASIAGFLGNEAVAMFRMKVGREIGSAALVAEGHHARADGLTSLAVLVGSLGVWLGYPLADPVVGLLIAAAILRIVWITGRTVFTRLLDGVDPGMTDEVRRAVAHTPGVRDVAEIRVRWLGHRLHAEVNIAVAPELSVGKGHRIAGEVRHRLMHHLRYLSNVTIHVDPADASGEGHHRTPAHEHGDSPPHSHG